MLTLKEAAHTIGCSESYIANLIKHDKLAAEKAPGGQHGRRCWQIDMTRQQLLEAVPVPATGNFGTHHKKKGAPSAGTNGHSIRYRRLPAPPRISTPLVGLTAWLQLPLPKRDLLLKIGTRFTVDDLAIILAL